MLDHEGDALDGEQPVDVGADGGGDLVERSPVERLEDAVEDERQLQDLAVWPADQEGRLGVAGAAFLTEQLQPGGPLRGNAGGRVGEGHRCSRTQ